MKAKVSCYIATDPGTLEVAREIAAHLACVSDPVEAVVGEYGQDSQAEYDRIERCDVFVLVSWPKSEVYESPWPLFRAQVAASKFKKPVVVYRGHPDAQRVDGEAVGRPVSTVFNMPDLWVAVKAAYAGDSLREANRAPARP